MELGMWIRSVLWECEHAAVAKSIIRKESFITIISLLFLYSSVTISLLSFLFLYYSFTIALLLGSQMFGYVREKWNMKRKGRKFSSNEVIFLVIFCYLLPTNAYERPDSHVRKLIRCHIKNISNQYLWWNL